MQALTDKGAVAKEITMSNQAASTATSVADLKTDFNALLTKLKAAGLMKGDS